MGEMSEILKKYTGANNNNNNINDNSSSEESSIIEVISQFQDVSRAKDELTQVFEEK